MDRDAESESGKLRSLLVNVRVCLPTSRPITERHFHFRAVGRGFGMHAQRYLKPKAIFRLICRYYILMFYVDSMDETRRLM